MEPEPRTETALPSVNFTVTLAERIKGMAGPPAWSLRLRRIEDLRTELARAVAALDARGRPVPRLPAALEQKRLELARLIHAHNEYFPIEANLPIDPHTSRFVHAGAPWSPLPEPTLETLRAAARTA